jgi:hypothetical protein
MLLYIENILSMGDMTQTEKTKTYAFAARHSLTRARTAHGATAATAARN